MNIMTHTLMATDSYGHIYHDVFAKKNMDIMRARIGGYTDKNTL
jgi:hypothetical protein